MAGGGPAMGVAAEILEHIVGTAEGSFGVNDPVSSEQWPEPGAKIVGCASRARFFWNDVGQGELNCQRQTILEKFVPSFPVGGALFDRKCAISCRLCRAAN